MKKLFYLSFCLCLISCYFGTNESTNEIKKGFYIAKWDENTWIACSKNGDSIYEPEKIVIGHNVFAVGHNEDFIIGKQHPCKNNEAHFMDYDSLKPNRKVTNFFIIDYRNDNYKMYSFNNERDFTIEKTRLGIPQNLSFQFYDKELE
ncbi:DUF3997 domain-containing protein [Flavobacterium chungnamense]|uniref:Lipoprotein n=1 Tax=Flavobacterium chungnamense TaxID=706182 RepID=A0ABP7UPL5_9FLAO